MSQGRLLTAATFHMLTTLLFMTWSPPIFASAPVGDTPPTNSEPYARRITLPPLKLLTPGKNQSQNFDPNSARFSHVCIVGTWNKQTQIIHDHFQKNFDFFNRFKVLTVAAFSHDTPETLSSWAAQNKPRYLFGLAQTEFIDSLKNPKVPTCWLLSRDGQILFKHEIPSDEILRTVTEKLRQWTEF